MINAEKYYYLSTELFLWTLWSAMFFLVGKEKRSFPYEPKDYRIYVGANEKSIYGVTRFSSAYDSRDAQKFAALSLALTNPQPSTLPERRKEREIGIPRFCLRGSRLLEFAHSLEPAPLPNVAC